jgi:hypothetical protein
MSAPLILLPTFGGEVPRHTGRRGGRRSHESQKTAVPWLMTPPSPYDGDTSYENGAVTRPIFPASWCAPGVLGVSYENGVVTRPIFPASWCAPGVLGVSPAKLGRRMRSARCAALAGKRSMICFGAAAP